MHKTFIFGSSGNVGKTTLQYLSKAVGKHASIKAGSRNPDKLKD